MIRMVNCPILVDPALHLPELIDSNQLFGNVNRAIALENSHVGSQRLSQKQQTLRKC